MAPGGEKLAAAGGATHAAKNRFGTDQAACQQHAAAQLSPAVAAVNNQAVGGALLTCRSDAKGDVQAAHTARTRVPFIRRFLIHVLPDRFHRIRHYGLRRSGTESLQTLRWREMDSNFRFRARCGFSSENFAVARLG